MSVPIDYQDTATFVRVTADGYSGNKTAVQQVDVPVIFIQSTDFVRSGFQENIDADAICYPKKDEPFITENADRLEGMYIIANLFGGDVTDAWYKVETCTVNRDHLLTNTIDNIELLLKKTKAIPGVS